MTSSKKKRLSMLDNLAAAGAPSPATAGSMMSANRALRSARDAVDSHNVWELDPALIIDDRVGDRLDPSDVRDLMDAIEANGQTVPILVRRHPTETDRYLLVYGRRRLEAIRLSDKVHKIRALVANLDDHAAITAQISENMARRDLSFIEKALFAQELINSGYGKQTQVAEALTVTKSSISMALTIAEMVGADLIRAIGAAHGIGRPRWESLGKAIEEAGADRDRLIEVADDAYTKAQVALARGESKPDTDFSVLAFEAVERTLAKHLKPAVAKKPAAKAASPTPKRSKLLSVGGDEAGNVTRTPKGVTITLNDGPFADWIEREAQELIDQLHAHWLEESAN